MFLLGSCFLKVCFIVEGKVDVFMCIGIIGEWDIGVL